MTCRLSEGQLHGFATLELVNEFVALTLIPTLGGKIAGLRHRPTDREWLWRNPRLTYARPSFAGSFVADFDLGGIDECFPAVAPSPYPMQPWQGTPIADHGELWSQPWQAIDVTMAPAQISVTLACHGLRFPYRFERTITLYADRAGFDLAYRATNLSAYPFPFIWSIHPILAIAPGMTLALPSQVEQMRVDFATAGAPGEAGKQLAWPHADRGDPLDLAQIPGPDAGWAMKLFAPVLCGTEAQCVSITTADGAHGLHMRFGASEITHVGLWLNYGGWAGDDGAPYFNLGLEPCLGGADSLAVALEQGEPVAVLEAHAERTWNLAIDLD